MSIDTWHEVFFTAVYYLAQAIFILGAVFLSVRRKKGSSYLCLLGFCLFLTGNIIMISSSRDYTEASQRSDDTSSIENTYLAGRIVSSSGFAIAAIGFFAFSLREKKSQERT